MSGARTIERECLVGDARTWLSGHQRRLRGIGLIGGLAPAVFACIALEVRSPVNIGAAILALGFGATVVFFSLRRLRTLNRIREVVDRCMQHEGVVIRSDTAMLRGVRRACATLQVEIQTRQGPRVTTTFRDSVGAAMPSLPCGAGVRVWTGRHECVVASRQGFFVGCA